MKNALRLSAVVVALSTNSRQVLANPITFVQWVALGLKGASREVAPRDNFQLLNFDIAIASEPNSAPALFCDSVSVGCFATAAISNDVFSFRPGSYSFRMLSAGAGLTGGAYFRAEAVSADIAPEPSTVMLIAAGLAVIATGVVRKRAQW